MQNRGLFIALYGANNLGKSTQIEMLSGFFEEAGIDCVRIKYPRYDSETGRVINQVLRGENGLRIQMDEEQLQWLFGLDRERYQDILWHILNYEKKWVLAEDYMGTGIAWGLTRGVDRELLFHFNENLMPPDVSILLDGNRFSSGIESGHRNESAGDVVWERNRQIHKELALELGWEVVNANQSAEKVQEDIRRIIMRKCSL